VRLFLDTSVLLAATGSATGASRAVFDLAPGNGWTLLSSRYCVAEAQSNLHKVSRSASSVWRAAIRPSIQIVSDSVVLDKPLVFTKAKDKPVLITALASESSFLLTLDRRDFGPFMSRPTYGLRVILPLAFLHLMRNEGRLIE
jgi:predicted nucleic acid-binding protein